MTVVKLNPNSGQIVIPKEYRDKHPNVLYFEVEINNNEIKYKPYFQDDGVRQMPGKKKYSFKDLKKAQFSSKNKKERNLAGKIDQILYGGK